LLEEQTNARREATLQAGGRILRRRRWRRAAFHSFAAIALLALTALSLQRLVPRRPPILTAVSPPPTPAVQSLTDAQLLALFPDTPVGLVTLEDGRKRLIFPRPGDEERFVKRL
jgi:hypothetical protein